jgi:hypothetical protein
LPGNERDREKGRNNIRRKKKRSEVVERKD